MKYRVLVDVLAVLVSCAAGCCPAAWTAYPEDTPPDEQLSNASGTHGYDMYIWNCLDGERVVVARYTSELTCRAPERQTAVCGGTTELEARVRRESVGPIRAGEEWR